MSEEQKACKQKTQTSWSTGMSLLSVRQNSELEFARAVRKILEKAIKEKVTITRIVNDPEWVIRIIRVDQEGGVSSVRFEAVFYSVSPFAYDNRYFKYLSLVITDDNGFGGSAEFKFTDDQMFVTVGSLWPSTHPIQLNLTFDDDNFR